MAEENETGDGAAEAAGGGMMQKIMMLVIGFALLGGGVFAGMTFLGGDKAEGGEAMAKEMIPSSAPALYTSLHPPLVVNFKDKVGESHFMQITMEVMARDQDVINSVREHTPVIRNALIMLFSAAVYEEVTTRDGKQQMLDDGLAEIQGVMTEQIGEPGVEAVYFTALIIQ